MNQQSPGSVGPMVRMLLRDLLVLVSLLLAAEVALRLLAPQPTERLLRGVYEGRAADFSYAPGTRAVCNNGFGDHEVAINQWRARDREYGAKQPGEWRILVVGDSFSDNRAMDVEEIYPNVLEANLARAYPSREISVISAGRGGWQLWNYEDYLTEVLSEMQPDVVVVAVGSANHLLTAARTPRRRAFTVWKGLPVPVHASPGKRALWGLWYLNELLEDHSHAYIAFRRLTHYPGQWIGVTRIAAFSRLVTDPAAADRVRGPATEVLGRIHDLCRRQGARLTLLHVPRIYEVDEAARALKIQLERPDLTAFDVTRPATLLREIAESLGLPLHDPIANLSAAPDSTYLPVYAHWNAEGNRRVARGLQDFLEKSGALGP